MTNKLSDIETLYLDDENDALVIIDQTLLPGEIKTVSLHTQEEIWDAIYRLCVRGAPAIGDAAAIAYYLAAKAHIKNDPSISEDTLSEMLAKDKAYLASSRPTAVNLFWALDKMEKVYLACKHTENQSILAKLKTECLDIVNTDIDMCKKIGEYGLSLIKDGDGVLTHCNAGRLATAKYGTATAPIYLAYERGMHLRVYADETRPLLQGARLTATELAAAGVDVTLLCDNMVSYAMKQGLINAVFVGCDRVAANGDTANKIGTSVVACVAKRYGIPFYVCTPTSTIDKNCASGKDIPIENRKAEEVTELWYKERMAPSGISVLNPAFDVTDADLITAIITEKGIVYPPFDRLVELCAE